MVRVRNLLFLGLVLLLSSVISHDQLFIIVTGGHILSEDNNLVLVAEDDSNLFEWNTLSFREDEGDKHQADGQDTDKHLFATMLTWPSKEEWDAIMKRVTNQIVLPADVCKSRRRGLEPDQRRETEYHDSDGHALGADVIGIDLSVEDKSSDVDSHSINEDKQISGLSSAFVSSLTSLPSKG